MLFQIYFPLYVSYCRFNRLLDTSFFIIGRAAAPLPPVYVPFTTIARSDEEPHNSSSNFSFWFMNPESGSCKPLSYERLSAAIITHCCRYFKCTSILEVPQAAAEVTAVRYGPKTWKSSISSTSLDPVRVARKLLLFPRKPAGNSQTGSLHKITKSMVNAGSIRRYWVQKTESHTPTSTLCAYPSPYV